MPRVKVTEQTVFKFDELNDSAKEHARDWFRQGTESDYYSECVINDAVEIGKMMGIEFQTSPVKLMNGTTKYDPKIYWDLGNGGGVAFSGRYRYVKGSAKKVKSHAPKDTELAFIVDGLTRAQKAHGYQIVVDSTSTGYDTRLQFDEVTEFEDAHVCTVQEMLKRFADWIHTQLQNEYEYVYSAEYVDEGIKANEYEFTEDGHIV